MNYEQKYKEALVKAQKELQCCGDLDCDAARQIFRLFPELKESEDERISREITEFLVDFNNGEYERPNENTIDSWLSWLEKQGKNKSAWSEEDEKIIETMCKEGDLKPSEMRWLKYLKDRVQPQPKQEWSEEDEKMLNEIIEDVMPVGECPDYPTEEEKEYFYKGQDKVDWLKSLKPNHWKPSEYDISLLEEIARNIRNNIRPFCSEVSSLEVLIDTLKNL